MSDTQQQQDATNVSQDVIQVLANGNRDELMTMKITLPAKRLSVALCENDRGRFVKLADGRSRIIVPADGIAQLRSSLTGLEHTLDTSVPSDADPAGAQPPVGHHDDKSELVDSQKFLSEGRKYYLDVLENARGRFLKMSQSSTRRVTLILPLAILPPLKRAIDMLLDKVPPDAAVNDPAIVQRVTRTLERVTPMGDGVSLTLNVIQREIRVMGKRVVFESGANRRGSYIKIMESSGPQRMTVMLPHSAVPEIIQLLQEVVADGDPADALPAPQNGQ